MRDQLAVREKLSRVRGQAAPPQRQRIPGAAEVGDLETCRHGQQRHQMIVGKLGRREPRLIEPAVPVQAARGLVTVNRLEGVAALLMDIAQ